MTRQGRTDGRTSIFWGLIVGSITTHAPPLSSPPSMWKQRFQILHIMEQSHAIDEKQLMSESYSLEEAGDKICQ